MKKRCVCRGEACVQGRGVRALRQLSKALVKIMVDNVLMEMSTRERRCCVTVARAGRQPERRLTSVESTELLDEKSKRTVCRGEAAVLKQMWQLW
jgi:hypothetical protein